jgi:hypothetical protein
LISSGGKNVVIISPPISGSMGRELKRFLRKHPADEVWLTELRDIRSMLVVEEQSLRT